MSWIAILLVVCSRTSAGRETQEAHDMLSAHRPLTNRPPIGSDVFDYVSIRDPSVTPPWLWAVVINHDEDPGWVHIRYHDVGLLVECEWRELFT